MRRPGGAVRHLLRWTELACDKYSCMPNVRLVRQTPACRWLSARRQGWAYRPQNVPLGRQSKRFVRWKSFAAVRCHRIRTGPTGSGQWWQRRKRPRSADRQRTGSPAQTLLQPQRERHSVDSFSYSESELNSDMPNVIWTERTKPHRLAQSGLSESSPRIAGG